MSNQRTSEARFRILRRTGWAVLALLVAIFVVSNLVLQSGWARNRAAEILERRSPLDWSIGSLTWTPWGGVRLGEIRAEISTTNGEPVEPVCTIGEIRVVPVWGQVIRGKRAWREIVVHDPVIAVPVELLASLAAPALGAGHERALASGPETPKAPPAPKPADAKPAASPSSTPEPVDPPVAPGPAVDPPPEPSPPVVKNAPTPKPPPKAAPAPSKKMPEPRSEDPRWIKVDGARLVFYSMQHPERRVEVRGLRAQLPVGGAMNSGWIASDGVWWGDQQLAPEWREAVEWKNAFLLLSERRREFNGMTIRMAGAIQPRGAMTTNLEMEVVPGPLGPLRHAKFEGIEVEAGRFGGALRFSGALRQPSGWRADIAAEASKVVIPRRSEDEPFVFEEGRFAASYRGGVLQAPLIRLVSERLSVLGNALAFSDGRAYAVIRLVADRESAEVVTRLALGAHLTGGWTRAWLGPLETPDRYFRDLHVRGRAGNLLVDVGRRGEELKVTEVWKLLVAFYNRESTEEDRGEPSSAPREMFFPAK